jgi:DNA-directed RNA polymerase specialized sigma24 family protein
MRPTRADITEVGQLYRQHGPALLLFAAAITSERSRAQDVLHQVFLKLLQDQHLRRAADVKAYLFACVRNAALNDARVTRRNIALPDEGLAWFEPPARDFAEEKNLRRALAELPDEQREVTVLHIWGGTYVCPDRRSFDDQRQYSGLALPLRDCPAARINVRQGGFLCRSAMTSNSKNI